MIVTPKNQEVKDDLVSLEQVVQENAKLSTCQIGTLKASLDVRLIQIESLLNRLLISVPGAVVTPVEKIGGNE